MLNLFAATGHINYAKNSPVFAADAGITNRLPMAIPLLSRTRIPYSPQKQSFLDGIKDGTYNRTGHEIHQKQRRTYKRMWCNRDCSPSVDLQYAQMCLGT
jgi:hypothetical protein